MHGQGGDKYENVRLGMTGRLDALQAAILIPKLEIFPDELKARQQVASTYEKLISSSPLNLKTPIVPSGYSSAWAQYSVLADDKEERHRLIERLKGAGIPTMIYYTKPLHLQKALSYLNYKLGDFPISEQISQRVFSLPMHPYLNESAISTIVETMAH